MMDAEQQAGARAAAWTALAQGRLPLFATLQLGERGEARRHLDEDKSPNREKWKNIV
jgi:hypothetical protein